MIRKESSEIIFWKGIYMEKHNKYDHLSRNRIT